MDIAEDQGNKPKKKGTTIKTRKSLVRKKNGDYGDSDDEDFAAAAKSKKAGGSRPKDDGGAKRTAASKAKIAAAAAVFGTSDQDDDEDDVPKRNRISLIAPRSEPSDTDMKPAPKAAPKRAPAPKKTAEKRKRCVFAALRLLGSKRWI